ncbi:MAG: helix-turn-helix transcriptional regulator [Lachnospiraceae bacterium]|nr:helix-turn-helix transcriptional regulator [Lachnospiraceae bacterium]
MSRFIKQCRINAGLTQNQLAEKMGVSVVSVQNWEGGRTKVEIGRYMELASVFNVPVEQLIKEMLIEEDKKRPDIWPGFLFNQDTNDIIDTLHLNHAQQDLFGLLFIYDSEYLKKTEIDFNTLYEDLKLIPYGFIEKAGSIQFMNQVDGLHKVIKYVKAEFLMKVLKQNPEAEFNVKKLSKELICEFIDEGFKSVDGFVSSFDGPERYEGEDGLCFHISMKKARIILPVLEQYGPVHITDGEWANAIRDDISEEVLSAFLQMCGFDPELWKAGYYKKEYNISYIRNGIETVTNYYPVSKKGADDCWMLDINEKGRQLLEWFREK